MSADLLQRAAAKARGIAEAATGGVAWEVQNDTEIFARWTLGEIWVADAGPDYAEKAAANAAHIALWHPVVALAVADWLDEVAEHVEVDLDDPSLDICPTVKGAADCSVITSALTVARALLGESA